MSLSAFRSSMIECEVYRQGIKLDTYMGLVSDSKDYNLISFELDPEPDIQVGDDIYCPMKRKHYMITNVEIRTISGKPHSFDAYFENNFTRTISNMTFNTYNPNNSIIGTQQNAVINITDSFDNLDKLIQNQGGKDIERLNELSSTLKSELLGNQIDKSKLSKFGDLIAKHSWLVMAISQIIAAWLQRG